MSMIYLQEQLRDVGLELSAETLEIVGRVMHEAYELGYQDGYDEGYDAGYSDGLEDGKNGVNED